MKNAYLVLADGTVFRGTAIGSCGSAIGETVFTTGMTGYMETLTDPSYFGQIVAQTFPLVGNYGTIPADCESGRSYVRGYIVRELCGAPSNFRCRGTLDSFLKEQNIVGISGIDTRRLTKLLRDAGVMNGMIVSGEAARILENGSPQQDSQAMEHILERIRAYRITDAVKSVQTIDSVQNPKNESGKKRVVLWDFGAKANIRRELEKRNLLVITVPARTTAEDIAALAPDGLMLSNGPGNPEENAGIIAEIQKLCDRNKNRVAQNKKAFPIFGICLGHQMIALARGAKTTKLKYGHRGGNQPVKDLKTGRVYISSQNHGYAVENESLPPFAQLRFINTNDKTCEGIEYTDIPAFSVQFHPEACSGPHDTNFLFDSFAQEIQKCL